MASKGAEARKKQETQEVVKSFPSFTLFSPSWAQSDVEGFLTGSSKGFAGSPSTGLADPDFIDHYVYLMDPPYPSETR